MSMDQGLYSSNEGEPSASIFNLTVSDFLKDVCSKYNEDAEKTVDIFIETLVQLLFKFTELLPSLQLQLNKIIRVLVDYGVQYRSTLHLNNQMGNKSEVERLKTCSSLDRQKCAFSILYDLDKKISDIQDVKTQIYNDIKKDFNIRNIKKEVVDDSFNLENTSSLQTACVETFQPESVIKLAEMVQKKIIRNSSDSVNVTSTKSSDNSEPEKEKKKKVAVKMKCNKQENIKETNPVVSFAGSSGGHKNKENRFSKHSDSMENLSSPITCLKIYKDCCIAGCENGQLQIFSCESRNLNDYIQAHSMAVTSLVLWNHTIVTSSLDESLKSFNLKKNSKKEVSIGHPIETTTDDLNGVLFAGTSTGKIFRFNILSMTQIGLMFHVSSTKILSMKIFSHSFKVLLVVSAENKPISIRNAETGTLLKTLLVNDIISFDIAQQEMLWFGISKKNIYAMSLYASEKIKNVSNKCLAKVCSYGNLILVCGSKGRLFVYNKDLILQRELSIELLDDISAVAIWEHFIVISFKNITKVKMLNLDNVITEN